MTEITCNTLKVHKGRKIFSDFFFKFRTLKEDSKNKLEFIHPSIYPPTHLPTFHHPTHPPISIHPSVHTPLSPSLPPYVNMFSDLFFLICTFRKKKKKKIQTLTYPSMFIHPSPNSLPPSHRPSFRPFVRLSVHPSARPSDRSSIHLSIIAFIHPSIIPPFHPFNNTCLSSLFPYLFTVLHILTIS